MNYFRSISFIVILVSLVSCESFHDEIPQISPEDVFLSDGTQEGDINQALYQLAVLFEDNLRNPITTDFLIDKFELYSEVKLASILSSDLLKGTSSIDDIAQIESALYRDTVQYYGAIMIPNFDVANFSLEPIIAPGVEVDYEGDDLVGDVALGWFHNDEGDKEYIYLDEALATSIERPVYIITDDDYEQAERINETNAIASKSAYAPLGDPYPKVVMVRISTTYGESKADYNVRELFVYEGGGSQVGSRRNFGNVSANVHTSTNVELLGFSLSNVLRGYGISYERDWLKSYKTVSWEDGRACASCCKMKISSDWYNRFWVDYENGANPVLWSNTHVGNSQISRSGAGYMNFQWVN